MTIEEATLKARIDHIRQLTDQSGSTQWFEAAGLAQTVLHDTVGGSHPLMATITDALEKAHFYLALAGARAVIKLFEQGGLTSPRLAIAHELEGDLLDIAQQQVQAAEASQDSVRKQVHLAIAAFLAGAAIEDALRKLCEGNSIVYDAQRTSISKLQAALLQSSKQIDVISASDNKQLTAWGDTRNKADHGKFSDMTHSEVLSMVVGVRGFIDRRLP